MTSTISQIGNGVKSHSTGNIASMTNMRANAMPPSKKREPTVEDIAFGKRLKQLREERGLTYEEFAAMTGVNYSQVWRWETGKNEVKRETIKAIAAALQISTDYLLGIVNEPRGLFAEESLTPQERRLIHMLRSGDIKKALNAISEIESDD